MGDLRLHFDGKLLELMEGPYLLVLEPDTLTHFITSETYNYVPRIKFAKFLLEWTYCDMKGRKDSFPTVFKDIKLNEIDPIDLQEIFDDPLIKEFPQVAQKVEKALKLAKKKKKPRDVDAVIVVGGKAANGDPIRQGQEKCFATDNVWAYLTQRNKWIALPKMPQKVEKPAAVYDGKGSLYVVDLDSKNPVDLYRFSFEEGKWSSEDLSCPPTIILSSIKQLVAIDHHLYLVAVGIGKTDKALNRSFRLYIFEVLTGELVNPIVLHEVSSDAKVRVCSLGRKFLLHSYCKKNSIVNVNVDVGSGDWYI